MTVIVGMEFEGRVYLAGDLNGTGSNNKVTHTRSKVFTTRSEYIVVGYSDCWRYGQILENMIWPTIPDKVVSPYAWLVREVIPWIREQMREAGLQKAGRTLVGMRGELWEIQDDFSVIRPDSGYYAIGSGAEYAMGALHALRQSTFPRNGVDVQALLHRAVRAAEYWCPSVGGGCSFAAQTA